MQLLIKTAGVIFITASSSLFGFFKTYSKRADIHRLNKMLLSFENAGNLLRLSRSSREKILTQCFSGIDGMSITSGEVLFSGKYASGELSGVINDFLRDFGSGDYGTEQQRIERVCFAVKARLNEEKQEYERSHKIWQTLGVCAGLALGIIFV